MSILTMFIACVEKNYILFALEKDKAGLVRFNIIFYSVKTFFLIFLNLFLYFLVRHLDLGAGGELFLIVYRDFINSFMLKVEKIAILFQSLWLCPLVPKNILLTTPEILSKAIIFTGIEEEGVLSRLNLCLRWKRLHVYEGQKNLITKITFLTLISK